MHNIIYTQDSLLLERHKYKVTNNAWAVCPSTVNLLCDEWKSYFNINVIIKNQRRFCD